MPKKAKSTKRTRRTQAEMTAIVEAIYATLQNENPMTLRQVFYALTVQGIVPKTEQSYDLIGKLLTTLRMGGQVPFEWIADNTRTVHKSSSYSGLKEFFLYVARWYRRDLWEDAPVYVELWLEKDALAGIIEPVTNAYDVPLRVTRGFSSITYVQEAAADLATKDKPCFIYHFGDHDPSGVKIKEATERRLRELAPDAKIYFERVAVTEEQIIHWKLPSRPTKTEGNMHAIGFVGESVELDAIPSTRLRQLVKDCIERHIDPDEHQRLKATEKAERASLLQWTRQHREGDRA